MSGGDDNRIKPDLNYPGFLKELTDLDAAELKRVMTCIAKLSKITWAEMFNQKGFNYEEIKGDKGKNTVRVSKAFRAVVVRQGDYMRFQALAPDHDGAYGKK